MIYQYKIKTIDGIRYICGSSLIAEKEGPTEPYQFSKPFNRRLHQEGRLLWAIRENPDYDPEIDHIDDRYIIEYDPVQPTAEELEAEKQAVTKQKLIAELPDIILQNKDNPEALAQALCERAKQIEVEVKDEPRRGAY